MENDNIIQCIVIIKIFLDVSYLERLDSVSFETNSNTVMQIILNSNHTNMVGFAIDHSDNPLYKDSAREFFSHYSKTHPFFYESS